MPLEAQASSDCDLVGGLPPRHARAWLFTIVLASALRASTAAAESAAGAYFDDHTLKGHTFLNPMLQSTAFVTTHFGISQGVAFMKVPRVLGPLGLSQSGLTQAVDSGVHLGEAIGVYATTKGEVSIGTDPQSLILLDNTFSISGEGGIVVRIARIEQSGTQLAVRVGAGAGSGRAMDVDGLINALDSGNDRTLQQVLNGKIGPYIFRPQATATLVGSLLAAQTLTPSFSLQASFEGRRTATTDSPLDGATGTRVDQTSKTTDLAGAVALTADGAPSGFPLGAIAEYRLTGSVTDGGDGWEEMQHEVALGLYYTGRRNLQLGISGSTRLGLKPVPGFDDQGNAAMSGTPWTLGGQFIFRYVW